MYYRKIKGALAIVVLASLAACNVNPSIMLKTDKDFKFDAPPTEAADEYKITPHDIIEFRLFANDGFKLIDLTAISESRAQAYNRTNLEYLVEFDGFCKLPIIGRVELSGMTIREAEKFLQEKYTKYYNKPFVLLKVMNRRVTVFPGTG